MRYALLTTFAVFLLSTTARGQEPADEQITDLATWRQLPKSPTLLVGKEVGILCMPGQEAMSLVGFSTGGTQFLSFAMTDDKKPVSRQDAESWGVKKPLTLVAIELRKTAEINRPVIDSIFFGRITAEPFIVDKVTVLEGNEEYPLHVAAIVEDLHAKYQAWRTQKSGVQFPSEKQMTANEMFVRWLPDKQRLLVRFTTYEMVDGPVHQLVTTINRDTWNARPVQSLQPDTPVRSTIGRAYEVDKTGRLVALRTFGPIASKDELVVTQRPVFGFNMHGRWNLNWQEIFPSPSIALPVSTYQNRYWYGR